MAWHPSETLLGSQEHGFDSSMLDFIQDQYPSFSEKRGGVIANMARFCL